MRASQKARLLFVLPVAVLTAAACEVNLATEGVTAQERRTFQVSGTPEISLDTFDGSIEVHSWDRNEVEVDVEKRAMEQELLDAITIESSQDGDAVTLKVTGPPRSSFRGVTVGVSFSPSARLRVALPRNSHLTARSGDGSITIEDVNGKLSLTTRDGSVRGQRLGGELVVRTDDGSIRLERVSGAVDLESGDGSITLEASPSTVRAVTADGSIRVRIDPDAKMAGDWEFRTADGSITLGLPPAFSADLDLESMDGTVRASHAAIPDRADRDEDNRRRRSLRVTMGEGGHVLRARTGDGSIRIED
ncbi:MAG: DUF4097 domain-containing protein [Vicinamibacterales bacterium]